MRLVATKLLEMVAGSVDEQMAGHLEATRKGYKVVPNSSYFSRGNITPFISG